MIISFIILERFYKDKINKIQMFFCVYLLSIYCMFMDLLFFLDYQVKEYVKLEVFWSWKEILNSMNTTYPKYELFLENILNVMLFVL